MPPDSTGHRCSVLVVEDDRDLQEVLRVALTADGYAVRIAENGRDAIDSLRSHADICFVLLDLLLPSIDGPAFRRIQLRDRSLAWIPVVVMSGATDAEAIARNLQAAGVVKKPIDLDLLRRELATTASRCRTGRNSEELAAVQAEP